MIESSEVKLHFLDYWRVIRVRFGLITLVFLLVMITAGVTTYFLPRRYLAKVALEVKPENSKALDILGATASRGYDPAYVATQFEILREAEILQPVIQSLHLEKVFAGDGPPLPPQITLYRLQSSLVLEEKRGTTMIEIGVKHTDPQVAAQIANSLAGVYVAKRQALLKEALETNLQQFSDQVEKQRARVIEEHQAAIHALTDLGIVDNDPMNPSAPILSGERTEASIETVVNEAKTKVDQLRAKLESINKLKPDELMENLKSLNIDSDTVRKVLPMLQDIKVEEKRMLQLGLGENHPHIREDRVAEEQYTQILQEEIEGIRRSQTEQLKLAEGTLKALTGSLTESTETAATAKQKTHDYVDLKTRYLEDKRILESMNMQLETERMKEGVEANPAIIWSKAVPPLLGDYAEPNVKAILFLSMLAGIGLGIALAFFIEYLDTSVKSLDDVERFLQIPVLAVVPRGVPILMRLKGEHPDAEAYRILRANIEFNKPSPDSKTVTLISGGPGEGKSTTLTNLAFTCAKGGYNVLVVDADLRRPSQHVLFETDNERGLSDYLSGHATIDSITRTTKIDNLSFISSGKFPSDNVGMLNSQRMTDLIHRVKTQYDLVFFDSPPILGVSDGSVLASEMDMTVMVVQHRRFPRAMLQRVKQAVNQVGGALIGVVLNNVDKKHDEGYSYYGAYNDYYSVPSRRAAGAPAPAPTSAGALAPRKPAAVPSSRENGEY